MLRFPTWLTVVTFGAIAIAALFASPNLLSEKTREAMPAFLPKATINLGLDLQGGSYLLLGVDTDKVIADRLTALKQDLQREMRPRGDRARIVLSSLPSVNAKDGVVSFSVKDVAKVEDAAERVRDATRAGLLPGAPRPYEVTIEGARISAKITADARRLFTTEALGDSIEVVRRRIDPAGNKEVSIQPQGTDRIVVQVPGDNDPEALKALINRTGQLSFHAVDPTVSFEDATAGVPSRIVVPFADASEGGALVLDDEPVITGDMVKRALAEPNSDSGGFQISFTFDNRGALRFGEYTREHIGDTFAIVLDNEIISAPTIQSAIMGGNGRITGRFSPEEATRIALLIRSGALPAPLTTLEQRTVGAGLGEDSIKKGAISLAVGFVGIALYMFVTYGRFGAYADIALFGNLILNMGVLTLFGSTLTLPGIAGIMLTIGMAVDANVLIFERTREELRAGKSVVAAVELGFDKAWTAILDTHVTTFFTAATMFILGAGPVRGFAVTLAVGTLTSMFSAILVTKFIAGRYVLRRRPKALAL